MDFKHCYLAKFLGKGKLVKSTSWCIQVMCVRNIMSNEDLVRSSFLGLTCIKTQTSCLESRHLFIALPFPRAGLAVQKTVPTGVGLPSETSQESSHNTKSPLANLFQSKSHLPSLKLQPHAFIQSYLIQEIQSCFNANKDLYLPQSIL